MKNSLSLLSACLFNLSFSIYPLAAYADFLEATNSNWYYISLNSRATIIDVVNGTALVTNANNISRPAIKGLVLQHGDLIHPSKGAMVLIKCGDRERQVRRLQGIGEICPDIVGNRGIHGTFPGYTIKALNSQGGSTVIESSPGVNIPVNFIFKDKSTNK
jgi:hypothetical protein